MTRERREKSERGKRSEASCQSFIFRKRDRYGETARDREKERA